MKRFVAIVLAAMMLLTLTITSAMAATATVTVEANTYKTGIAYTTRAASGSFWKGQNQKRPTGATKIDCYLYRKGGDRCTKIVTFSDTALHDHQNYLAGQAVTGAQYKFVFRGNKAGDYTNYFNP